MRSIPLYSFHVGIYPIHRPIIKVMWWTKTAFRAWDQYGNCGAKQLERLTGFWRWNFCVEHLTWEPPVTWIFYYRIWRYTTNITKINQTISVNFKRRTEIWRGGNSSFKGLRTCFWISGTVDTFWNAKDIKKYYSGRFLRIGLDLKGGLIVQHNSFNF